MSTTTFAAQLVADRQRTLRTAATTRRHHRNMRSGGGQSDSTSALIRSRVWRMPRSLVFPRARPATAQ